MLQVRNLLVQSFDLDHYDLSWAIEPTTADPLDYTFEVQRSMSSESGWETICGPFTDRYLFRDASLPRPIFQSTIYYRLKITNKRTQEVAYTEDSSMGAPPSLRALEMIRQLYVRLREFNGRKVLVFTRRTFGQHCPNCFVGGLKVSSHCRTCFDVGFVGGYNQPIETLMQIDPVQSQSQATDRGKVTMQQTGGETIPFPALTDGDLVVEAENKRWEVVTMPGKEVLRHPTKQNVRLIGVMPGDILWDIPVTWDIDSIKAGPLREMNPISDSVRLIELGEPQRRIL